MVILPNISKKDISLVLANKKKIFGTSRVPMDEASVKMLVTHPRPEDLGGLDKELRSKIIKFLDARNNGKEKVIEQLANP